MDEDPRVPQRDRPTMTVEFRESLDGADWRSAHPPESAVRDADADEERG